MLFVNDRSLTLLLVETNKHWIVVLDNLGYHCIFEFQNSINFAHLTLKFLLHKLYI